MFVHRKGGAYQQMPIRVAVIGGGCASIAAAFELSRPQHQGKYEVTVYQLGWRLGGKGASGRGTASRIEEHGFHVWFGFYENSVRLMRECYAELNRDPQTCRISDWRDAFLPAPFIGMASRSEARPYEAWLSYFPAAEGLPGDPPTNTQPFSISSYLAHTASALRSMLLTGETLASREPDGVRRTESPKDSRDAFFKAGGVIPEDLTLRIARLLKFGLLATTAGIVEGLGLLRVMFERLAVYPQVVLPFLEALSSAIRQQIEPLFSRDPELALVWPAIDL